MEEATVPEMTDKEENNVPNILIHQASECEPDVEANESANKTNTEDTQNSASDIAEKILSSPETGEICPTTSTDNNTGKNPYPIGETIYQILN